MRLGSPAHIDQADGRRQPRSRLSQEVFGLPGEPADFNQRRCGRLVVRSERGHVHGRIPRHCPAGYSGTWRALRRDALVSAALEMVPPPEPERVLVVDDEAPIVHALRRTFEAAGYKVTACMDPNEALERLS